jgi:hypothetical protein
MAATPARSLASRLRNLVVFVTIVWGVAATFVAFELVSLSAGDLASSYPAVFGNLALSRTVTQSTSCTLAAGETPVAHSATVSPTDARVGAWFLGVGLGRDAVLRQFARANTQALGELVGALNSLADRLGVPPPAVFRPDLIANANIEFVTFIEQDAGQTSHRLALLVSPQACELFKLGAFWGYSDMRRPTLPGERAVFAMEIRYHAQRAEIPEPLWIPMLQRIPANAKPDEVTAQMTALTNGVATYLAGQR